jgi:hypothetical protein
MDIRHGRPGGRVGMYIYITACLLIKVGAAPRYIVKTGAVVACDDDNIARLQAVKPLGLGIALGDRLAESLAGAGADIGGVHHAWTVCCSGEGAVHIE